MKELRKFLKKGNQGKKQGQNALPQSITELKRCRLKDSDRILDTSLTNGPTKLECYTAQSWKGLPGKNTLAQ